jgi:hypothetical protein
MARGKDPKSLANLRPCKPGETHNPNGRPKKLVNAIKDLPKDMQEKVYGVLAFALTLPDETSAKAYLDQQSGELGQYGFVLQVAIKQLTKDGWGFGALMDIMDRLYGKPRISAEVAHSGGIALNIITDQETKDLIEGGIG